ncbi:MAG: permease [Bacillota bacterium]
MSFTLATWALAVGCLVISWWRDRTKTRQALVKAWKAFEGILPEFLGILLLIGLSLALLPPSAISAVIGARSGFWGMLLTSFIGSITLIPGFIAFPLAKSLYMLGAGTRQLAVFISTLMMVGVVTAPVEIKYFGKKATLARNLLAYCFSFLVAMVVGAVAG